MELHVLEPDTEEDILVPCIPDVLGGCVERLELLY